MPSSSNHRPTCVVTGSDRNTGSLARVSFRSGASTVTVSDAAMIDGPV
jgi:hypothetical protein